MKNINLLEFMKQNIMRRDIYIYIYKCSKIIFFILMQIEMWLWI